MSSILLNPLYFSSQNIDSIYDSNIENQINSIELNQIKNIKNDFLCQFDELKFDNKNLPVGINEISNNKGLNKNLERDIEFKNGYSNIQNKNMHYDVVTDDDFFHNNTMPNYKRDIQQSYSKDFRTLELFTGTDSNYIPKTEKEPLFEPLKNLTWINGMPVVTSDLQNRYLPSNKNNHGNLPFNSNLRVKPGVDYENQAGPYNVYRINPANIDALRSENNQKISYENKPLETIKLGEKRAENPTISKYKLPDYIEKQFSDLLPSRSQKEGPILIGEFTDIQTQRNEKQNQICGPAINSNKGSGPDQNKTKFSEVKKENYINDSSHAVTSIYNKPILNNIKSFQPYENQRDTTNIAYEGSIGNNGSIYSIDYSDIPLTTLRQLMIHNDNIGTASGQEKHNYIFSNDMVLPVTNRQTVQINQVKGINSEIKNANIYNNDKAKMTLRPQTSHNMVINSITQDRNVPIYNEDMAKMTLRPETSHNMVINSITQDRNVPIYNEDMAKMTLRPETSHNMVINSITQDRNVPVYNENRAKMTLRPETSHNIAINSITQDRNVPVYNVDMAKMTLRPETSHNMVINSITQDRNVPVYNEDRAKMTLRPETSHNMAINSITQDRNVPVYNEDRAKMTSRPETSHNMVINSITQDRCVPVYNEDRAKMTSRPETSHNMVINSITQDRNVPIYNEDMAKMTLRPETSHNMAINSITQDRNVPVYNEDRAKMTLRPETSHNMAINSITQDRNVPVYNEDRAKMTLRPETSHNMVINSITQDRNVPIYNEDMAKMTSRPETSHNMAINSITQDRNVPIYNEDRAKMTLRPETSHNMVINSITQDRNVPIYNEDRAKMTLRPETSHNMAINSITQDRNVPIYNEDRSKMTLRPETSHNMAINSITQNRNVPIYNEDKAKITIKETNLFRTPEININNCENYIYSNLQDKLKPTIKETNIINNRESGNISNTVHNYTIDNNYNAKNTIRQIINEKMLDVTNISNNNIDTTYVRDILNKTRPTIRQSTENSNYISNVNNYDNLSYTRDINDKAKITIKELTENNNYISNINNSNETIYIKDKNYDCKPTIKQTTLHGTHGGRINNSNMGNILDLTDKAKITIKQTSLLQNYTGVIKNEIEKPISHLESNNMEIDERRELLTFNRHPNGKADLHGPYIEEENVNLRDPLLYSYVSHPHKNLDQSVMPSCESINRQIINPKDNNGDNYHINDNFINTLEDNPYVNDLFHQKNY